MPLNQSLVNKQSTLAEEDWYGMRDVFSCLSNPWATRVPLYVYVSQAGPLASAFVYSMLVPKNTLNEKWESELENWNVRPDHSWGYGQSFENGSKTPRLFPPYTEYSPNINNIVESGHPITILRYHPLHPSNAPSVEICQEITHTHGLHWSERHSAYIRLDELGDTEECIRVRTTKDDIAIDILPNLLKLHLFVGHYVLIRFFDVQRWDMDDLFFSSENGREKKAVIIDDQSIRTTLLKVQYKNGGSFCQLRGLQCVSIFPGEEKTLWQELEGEKPKEYCTFLIHDWKNNRIVEWSLDPKSAASYFIKSDLPYETSPAFFSREVLRKYKDDPEKYTIDTAIIHCRGAWSLRYGINNAGQVHAYICDLGYLPYKEQLHWKQYNEDPKTGLSESTIRRDFYAEFAKGPFDPLTELKTLLISFPSLEEPKYGPLWAPPNKDNIKRLIYMTGESQKEWEDDILLLNKAVIESFNPKCLRKYVQSLSPELPDTERLGSIELLNRFLQLKGIAEDIREDIISPLKEVQEIRSKVCGHRQGRDANEIISKISAKHKMFSKHERYLVEKLYTALRSLANLIQKGVLKGM